MYMFILSEQIECENLQTFSSRMQFLRRETTFVTPVASLVEEALLKFLKEKTLFLFPHTVDP